MKLDTLEIRSDKIKQFNKKGIYELEDLLNFIPRKYLDFREPKKFLDIHDGDEVLVILKVQTVEKKKSSSGRSYVYMVGYDQEHNYYTVMYFNQDFMFRKLSSGIEVAICGKASVGVNYRGTRQVTFINPYITETNVIKALQIKPMYSKVQGMSDEFFNTCMNKALQTYNFNEYLEQDVIKRFDLFSLQKAYQAIHSPKDLNEIEQARKRLLFNDLFFFNYMLERKKSTIQASSSYILKKGTATKTYYKNLKFELTEGQLTALRTLLGKGAKKERINALVQGDVGCGKTEVAKIMMLSAVDAGQQAVLLAPTVVLARQHYQDCVDTMEGTGVRIAFISSDLKASEKKMLVKKIKEHEIDIVVGTHAILNPVYEFDQLSLVIVDEEHRFGVKQREALVERLKNGVHSISMSATPIPRTLALSMYGDDIDIIEIKTLPRGKKPIKTAYVKNEAKALNALREVIKRGDQAYVVCPLVEENEEMQAADINTVFKNMCNYYANDNIRIGCVSGKMKEAEVKKIINQFKEHELDILISTTVIEVGVNVPNATVIWIKNAERFGIAQLHQLRGRVGRGIKQGFCWLEADLITENAKQKIALLCESNDGFYLAQKDLEMRGAGDFIGTVQSGTNKYMSLVLSNPNLNGFIKEEIKKIFASSDRRVFYEERMSKKIEDLFDDEK